MSDRSERLKRAREEAGFDTPTDALRAFGWSANTYPHNENGSATFSFPKAKIYARAFGVRAEWIYDGTLPMRSRRAPGIAVLGKIAAGGEGDFSDDYEMGGASDWLEPLDPAEHICLVVEGESMIPLAYPGERAVFGPRFDDPTPLVGERVMARVSDDDESQHRGKKLFKVLRAGRESGLWTLFSVNSAYGPIEDVRLAWALPFKELRARR